MTDEFPKARLRLILKPGVAFGPGKADLLEGIAETGSIGASGRRLKMSYRRAWKLISDLNSEFELAVVETEKGGTGGGGSRLTPFGAELLARYRSIEATLLREAREDIAWMSDAARALPDPDQGPEEQQNN